MLRVVDERSVIGPRTNALENFLHQELDRHGLAASRCSHNHEVRRCELRRNAKASPSDARIVLVELELGRFGFRKIDGLWTSSN